MPTIHTKHQNCLLKSRELAQKIVQVVEDEYPGQNYASLMIKHDALALAFHLVNGTNRLQDFIAGFQLKQIPRNYIQT